MQVIIQEMQIFFRKTYLWHYSARINKKMQAISGQVYCDKDGVVLICEPILQFEHMSCPLSPL